MSRASATERVAVIGAGIIGLSTAWFLQERGIAVTVYDRAGVGSGSSRSNAGWLVPNLVSPLPEPAVLRGALRSLARSSAPLYIPLRSDGRQLRFLAGLVRNCTHRRWARSMEAFAGVTGQALAAFDALDDSLAQCTQPAEPFLVCFRTPRERATMVAEFAEFRHAGQKIEFDELSGDEARSLEPALSGVIGAALAVHGQRFIDPGQFLDSLAARVIARGGEFRAAASVCDLVDVGEHVVVDSSDGERDEYDAAVVATGAWLSELGQRLGVRRLVAAGRGYSFTIGVSPTPTRPLYFPNQRVACTPIDGRLRVAGMMEFRPANAPLDQRRIAAIEAAAAPLFVGADYTARTGEWVGSRPCTTDGRPLIGATASPRIYAAGGHGMWGMTLGPWTGQAVADLIATGVAPAELAPFDPLR